jgi:hypothetical protein
MAKKRGATNRRQLADTALVPAKAAKLHSDNGTDSDQSATTEIQTPAFLDAMVRTATAVIPPTKLVPFKIVSNAQTSLAGFARGSEQLEDEVQSKASKRCDVVIVSTPKTESTISSLPLDEYPKFANDLGGTTDIDSDKRAIKRFTRETLFSKLKFLNTDAELDYTGKCCAHHVVAFVHRTGSRTCLCIFNQVPNVLHILCARQSKLLFQAGICSKSWFAKILESSATTATWR